MSTPAYRLRGDDFFSDIPDAPKASDGLPDSLVQGILKNESGGKHYDARGNVKLGPVTRTGKRAIGKWQVMPDALGGRTRAIGGQTFDLYDEAQNEQAGRAYLSEGLKAAGGDPQGAALYYFGGPGALNSYKRTGRIPQGDDLHTTMKAYVQNATSGQTQKQSSDDFFSDVPDAPKKADDFFSDVPDSPAAPTPLVQGEAVGASPTSLPSRGTTQSPATFEGIRKGVRGQRAGVFAGVSSGAQGNTPVSANRERDTIAAEPTFTPSVKVRGTTIPLKPFNPQEAMANVAQSAGSVVGRAGAEAATPTAADAERMYTEAMFAPTREERTKGIEAAKKAAQAPLIKPVHLTPDEEVSVKREIAEDEQSSPLYRILKQPAQEFSAGLGAQVGNTLDRFGIAPEFAQTLRHSAFTNALVAETDHAKNNPSGYVEEFFKRAYGATINVTALIAMQRVTRAPLPVLLASQSLAQNMDKPEEVRAREAGRAAGFGLVLEKLGGLTRLQGAAGFGALEPTEAYLEGERNPRKLFGRAVSGVVTGGAFAGGEEAKTIGEHARGYVQRGIESDLRSGQPTESVPFAPGRKIPPVEPAGGGPTNEEIPPVGTSVEGVQMNPPEAEVPPQPVRHVDAQTRRKINVATGAKGQFKKETATQRETRRAQVGGQSTYEQTIARDPSRFGVEGEQVPSEEEALTTFKGEYEAERNSLAQDEARLTSEKLTEVSRRNLTRDISNSKVRLSEMADQAEELFGERAKEITGEVTARQVPETAPGEVGRVPSESEAGAGEAGGQITGFTTAKGSTYTVSGESTQRTKSLHEGHDPADIGLKEPSVKTLYLKPEDASEVGTWNTMSNSGKRILIRDGEVLLTSTNPKTDERGLDGRFKFTTAPEVGKSPLELSYPETVQGREGYKGNHPGNAITEIRRGGTPVKGEEPTLAVPSTTRAEAQVQERASQPTRSTVRANAKVEKVNPRTGFTKTQSESVASDLREGVAKLPLVGRASEPLEIKVPDDGEFTIYNKVAASTLHKKIAGEPIEGVPVSRPASGVADEEATKAGREKGNVGVIEAKINQALREPRINLKAVASLLNNRAAAFEDTHPLRQEIRELNKRYRASSTTERLEIEKHSAELSEQLKQEIEKDEAQYLSGLNLTDAQVKNVAEATAEVVKPVEVEKPPPPTSVRGKSIQEARAEATLNKKFNYGKDGILTRREWLQKKIGEGSTVTEKKVPDEARIRQLEREITGLRRDGEPSGNSNYPTTKRYYALKAELDAKPTKSEYRIEHADDTLHDITKTEYDYGRTLTRKGEAGKLDISFLSPVAQRLRKALGIKEPEPIEPSFRLRGKREQNVRLAETERSNISERTELGGEAKRPTPISGTSGTVDAETRPSVRSRSFPKSAEEAGLSRGTNLTYEVVGDKPSVDRANKRIDSQGADRVAADIARTGEPTKDDIVAGQILARKYSEAGDHEREVAVINDLADKLTRAGQTVQAASLIDHLSPEGSLIYGQRILNKRGANRTLTKEESTAIKDAAQKVREASAKVASQTAETPKAKFSTLEERLNKADTDARAKIADTKRKMASGELEFLNTGPVPGWITHHLNDLATIGAVKVAKRAMTLARWTDEMVKDFGEEIRPHLEEIRRRSLLVYNEQRDAVQREQTIARVTDGRPEDFTPEQLRELLTADREQRQALRKGRADLTKGAPQSGPQKPNRLMREIAAKAQDNPALLAGASKIAARPGITSRVWSDEMASEFGLKGRDLSKAYRDSYQLYREASASVRRGGRTTAELDAQTELRQARQELSRTYESLGRSPLRRGLDSALNTLGLSRALTTLAPFHAAFKHTKAAIVPHPIVFAKAFVKQVEALNSAQYERFVSEVQLDPKYKYAQKFGVGLTGDFGGRTDLAGMEEATQSNWIHKIPGIKHSGQAFNTMVNVTRFGWFKEYMKYCEKLGYNPDNPAHAHVFKQGAELVNNATGRGSLPGTLDKATPALNNAFFSTRLWASRLKMISLPFDPRSYLPERAGGLSRPAKVESWKTLFGFTGLVGLQMYLAHLAGARVSFNRDDDNFLQASWGRFHWDATAGMGTNIKYALKLAEAIRGNEKQKFGDILQNYVVNHLAPIPSGLYDIAQGKDRGRRPVYAWGRPGSGAVGRVRSSRVAGMFWPMSFEDAKTGYEQSGLGEDILSGLGKAFGEGTEVYAPRGHRQR